jgi:hypothetical protein
MNEPIDIFFSYAHEDERLVKDIQRQLCIYKRLLEISPWHDRRILPGSNWRNEIDERLRSARIILLFVSSDFIASDYCYGVEMAEALRRQQNNEATVIPIILRACPWDKTPLAALQALPTDGQPIVEWSERDQACLDVARGIMSAVERMASSA